MYQKAYKIHYLKAGRGLEAYEPHPFPEKINHFIKDGCSNVLKLRQQKRGNQNVWMIHALTLFYTFPCKHHKVYRVSFWSRIISDLGDLGEINCQLGFTYEYSILSLMNRTCSYNCKKIVLIFSKCSLRFKIRTSQEGPQIICDTCPCKAVETSKARHNWQTIPLLDKYLGVTPPSIEKEKARL